MYYGHFEKFWNLLFLAIVSISWKPYSVRVVLRVRLPGPPRKAAVVITVYREGQWLGGKGRPEGHRTRGCRCRSQPTFQWPNDNDMLLIVGTKTNRRSDLLGRVCDSS